MTLHLDAISEFILTTKGKTLKFEDEFPESTKRHEFGTTTAIVDTNVSENILLTLWKKVSLLSLTTPVLLVSHIARKAIRSSFQIASGLLTFDMTKIGFALTDYLSIIVEAIALPILGFVSIFSEKKALSCAASLKRSLGEDRFFEWTPKDSSRPWQRSFLFWTRLDQDDCYSSFRNATANLINRLSSLCDMTLFIFSREFSFAMNEGIFNCHLLHALTSPLYGLSTCFASQAIFEDAMGIYYPITE